MNTKNTIVSLVAISLFAIMLFALTGCTDKTTSTASASTEFVNAKCPIMGSAINPDNIPASLIREYKGKKVAFCCGGCPAAWDKLTDQQKDDKLAKVMK